MLTSGPPRRVPPNPPPSRRDSQPLTVRARSTSTKTRLPSIFLPSPCLYAAGNFHGFFKQGFCESIWDFFRFLDRNESKNKIK